MTSKPRAIAIGNFDGVHRGHQAVLTSMAEEARRRGLTPAILTFAPHPKLVLGRPVPPLLTRPARKRELVERLGVAVRVLTFDDAFAAQSPEAFARDVLAREDGANARMVVVGHNFRFGKDRAGSFDDLTRLGPELGFDTRSHELAGDEGGAWSSSRVRGLVGEGAMEEARRILGRPHMISGRVVEGDRRGRTLGFPTCNLAEVTEMLPPLGVYAVVVDRELEGGRVERVAQGVANIGVRPTVDPQASVPRVEVNLFDWSGDLYGATLRAHLVTRLRAEQRFAGLDALKAQIALDAALARDALARSSLVAGDVEP